jgi:hypothetical protein
VKVEKISEIPSLYPIPIEHYRWAGLGKIEPEERTKIKPKEELKKEIIETSEVYSEDPGLYDRWGRIKKNNLPKLIKII